MSPLTYVKIAFGLLLIGLGYFAYATYEKLGEAKQKLKETTAQLVALSEQKKLSDEAAAELRIELNKQQAATERVITKIVRVPYAVEEKCMSPVLKEALKEND